MTPPPPPGQPPIPPRPPGYSPGYAPNPPMPYPQPVLMMQPPRRGGWASAIFMTLATVIFAGSLALNFWLLTVNALTSRSEFTPFAAETKLRDGDANARIAIVKLDGEITDSSIEPVVRTLDQLQDDGSVRGLIFEIDSPGGAVTPSDELYARLLRFKKEKAVPVFVSMKSLAASGGYYVAMAADKLWANETTLTGSIGVLMQRYDLTKLADKYGVEDGSIVSDGATFKESGSALKPMTPEDQAYFKSLVNDAFATFKARIASGRPKLTKAEIDALANGKVYTAHQALDAGLIDATGYLDDVIADVTKVASLSKPQVVRFERQASLAQQLLGVRSPTPAPDASAITPAALADFLRPRLYYRWQGQ